MNLPTVTQVRDVTIPSGEECVTGQPTDSVVSAEEVNEIIYYLLMGEIYIQTMQLYIRTIYKQFNRIEVTLIGN